MYCLFLHYSCCMEESIWRRKICFLEKKKIGEEKWGKYLEKENVFFCGGEEELRGKIRENAWKRICRQLEKDGRANKGHWKAEMSNLETVQVINGHWPLPQDCFKHVRSFNFASCGGLCLGVEECQRNSILPREDSFPNSSPASKLFF